MQTESYVTKQRMDKANLWRNSKPFLGWLDFELTERCNNNCVHCCINLPADDLAARNRELSTEEIKRILKEAVSLVVLRLDLPAENRFYERIFKNCIFLPES